MKEALYKIPLIDAFKTDCECPFCVIERDLENKALDFRLKGLLLEERKSVIEIAQKRLAGRARVLWEKGEAEHLHVELID